MNALDRFVDATDELLQLDARSESYSASVGRALTGILLGTGPIWSVESDDYILVAARSLACEHADRESEHKQKREALLAEIEQLKAKLVLR